MRSRFLFVLVLALLLAACGQGGTGGTAATSAPPAAPTAAAAPTTAPAATTAPEATAVPEATAAPAATGTIKIGILGPFTGGAATVGQEQLNFAKLAVEDYNKANGTSIELVEGDTELDPAKAVTVAQRLVSDNDIYALIGPAGSQEVIAVAPVVGPAKLAFISPSATRVDLTESNFTGFFRVVPRDDVQGTTDANFMIDQIKAKNVWIIDDQSAYATGLRDAVQKVLKEKSVSFTTESITQKDSDFSALVTKIKGDAPDVVFIPWQLAPQASLFAKQMAEQGVKATIFGADGLFDAKNFIEGAAGATDGAYVSFFAPDVSGVAAAKPVVEAYKAKYGGEIGPFGAPAYVATMVALEAIGHAQKGGTLSRETVLAEVPKTDMQSSILGIPIKFDSKGDVQNASFFLFQVKDGKFELVTKS
ncbi:MAG: branched-chain amino acid ABC transporter substrate-binding protein [Roseiflexaceae bacterium]